MKRMTVYQKIVEAMIFGEETWKYLFFFLLRGHSLREYFRFKEYVGEFMQYAMFVVGGRMTLAEARALVKKDVNFGKIPRFKWRASEERIFLDAEDEGRIRSGDCVAFDNKLPFARVHGVDAYNPPNDVKFDAFVVFSGHSETAVHAVRSWLYYVEENMYCPALIFLGDEIVTARHKRVFAEHGVSCEILDECTVTVDENTTDVAMFAETLRKHFWYMNSINVLLFSYPAYGVLSASKFWHGLRDVHGIPAANIFIADWEPSIFRESAYDNFNAAGPDIILGCLADTYLEIREKRVDYRVEYPDEWKALLPLCLGYSSPDAAAELADIYEEIVVVFKLLRDKMFQYHKWEDANLVGRQVDEAVNQSIEKLLREKVIDDVLVEKGAAMTPREWFRYFSRI